MEIDKSIMNYSIKEMNEIFEEETANDVIDGILTFTKNFIESNESHFLTNDIYKSKVDEIKSSNGDSRVRVASYRAESPLNSY